MKYSSKPYINIKYVERIYIILNGSLKNFSAFEKEARQIGSTDISKTGACLFDNDIALFDLFASAFPEELKARKITQMGELIQLAENYPYMDEDEYADEDTDEDTDEDNVDYY